MLLVLEYAWPWPCSHGLQQHPVIANHKEKWVEEIPSPQCNPPTVPTIPHRKLLLPYRRGSSAATVPPDLASTKSDVALLDLGSDVLVEILSYLGSGRIEQGPAVSASRSLGGHTRARPARSTTSVAHQPPLIQNSPCLIRTIPFVNKQLRRLCDVSDVLWVTILKRMIRSDPMGWEESVLALVEGRYHVPSLTATSVQNTVNGSSFCDLNTSPPWAIYGEDSPIWRFRVRFKGRKLSTLSDREDELGHFVELLCQIVGHRRQVGKEHEEKGRKPAKEENTSADEMSDAKHTTIHLVLSRRVYSLPLLHIPTPSRSLRIGHMIRLDASDPRHRPTVSAITIRQKRRDLRCGSPLSHPPRFVLRSSGIVGAAVPGRLDAHLVELHRCHLQQSGRRADLFIVPIERIRITDTEERGEDDEIVDASFQLNLSLSN